MVTSVSDSTVPAELPGEIVHWHIVCVHMDSQIVRFFLFLNLFL